MCLEQLKSDLATKQFRSVLKVMQATNASSPVYLLPEDLTAAHFTSAKYVIVTRQDLRRYLRQFLASLYCYNQMRRQGMFQDFEFMVALRFKTISLCYNHSIFAEPVEGYPKYHDKLHFFAAMNGIKHLYWGAVGFIQWLGYVHLRHVTQRVFSALH
jgi:hypothetical protein